jgi:hypothetical protein
VTEVDLGMTALLSLVPLSILVGVAALLVFRRFSDQAAIRRSKSLVFAHLLEFRLFMDEPGLILRAQRDLIVANGRLLKYLMRPVLILVVPMALLLAEMDAFYSRAPLPLRQAAIVTVQMKDAAMPVPLLMAPADITIETPAVRIVNERQISWRIRPTEPSSGVLRLVSAGNALTKTISAGRGIRYISQTRFGSFANFLLHPTEWPFSHAAIEWVEVRYPSAVILRVHWLVWFFGISMLSALVLRRRFQVSF